MARITLLKADGKTPETTKDGQLKFIYSVDGRQQVQDGELMEVREVQQIGDKKKSVLVAYRPCTQADKAAKTKAKKAAAAKLLAEIAAEEAAENGETVEKPKVKKKKAAEPVTEAPKTDAEDDLDDFMDEESEIESEDAGEPKTAKPAGRKRPARTKK